MLPRKSSPRTPRLTKAFKRRSEAAKKGWRTRRRNIKIAARAAKQRGSPERKKRKRHPREASRKAVSVAKNQEYIVTTVKTRKGREQKGKQVDLFIVYIEDSTDQEIIEFIVEWYTEINPESPDAWVLNLIAKAQQIIVARGPITNREWIVKRRS